KTFSDVTIDKSRLSEYRGLLNFPQELPFSYLYILAQRAQLAVMLESEFSISIPGMIHLNNNLIYHNTIDPNTPMVIKTTVSVESKTTGSLYPNSEVEFYQNDEKVASCLSGYLVKRKSKGQQTKKVRVPIEIPQISSTEFSETWEISKSIGKEYGKVSGDRNPIHTSKLFAKFVGFKRQIVHGWYSASRVIRAAQHLIENINQIHVNFNKPLYLPGTAKLKLEKSKTNTDKINFTVTSLDSNITHLYGDLQT
ncbi:MAG: MaoC/PaaZ C-terminal domain-containing protein, partial [Candidatus Kariarchaeaceae archaeon]